MAILEAITGIAGALGSIFGGGKNKTVTQHEARNEWTENKSAAESQDLSPELLKALEGLFVRQIGTGQLEQGGQAVQQRLAQLMDMSKQPQFDVERYAAGIRNAATSAAQLDLESSINGMLSSAGVSEGGNSMNALIANKLRGQTAAQLGGVFSQAFGQGEQIRQAQQQQITEGVSGLGGQLAEMMLGLVAATRGASQTGKSETLEHAWGKSVASTKGEQNIPSVTNNIGSFFTSLGKNLGKTA